MTCLVVRWRAATHFRRAHAELHGGHALLVILILHKSQGSTWWWLLACSTTHGYVHDWASVVSMHLWLGYIRHSHCGAHSLRMASLPISCIETAIALLSAGLQLVLVLFCSLFHERIGLYAASLQHQQKVAKKRSCCRAVECGVPVELFKTDNIPQADGAGREEAETE